MLQTSEPKRIRIADIAQSADVSQVTIYNYFGSKEALLREAFKSYVDSAILEFEMFMNGEHTLKEKIKHILFVGREVFKELPPGTVRDLVHNDPELARYVEDMYRNYKVPMTVRIIEEGKRSGEISEDVSVDSVLAYMQIHMNQYETILDAAQRSENPESFFDGITRLFFYGICGKSDE
ncbi:TetR/AcrR family transcriptional regulator [Cohnella terricola]